MSALAKAILLLLISAGTLFAQEVGYLDLRGIEPRMNLQYPQTPPICHGNICTGSGGVIGMSIGCGAGSPDDPRALKATILSLDHSSYVEGDQAVVEIKLENVGTVPMTLPWYPHPADLQSSDITARLKYLSSYFQLTLTKPGETGYNNLQIINLYGNQDVPNTLITIRPGEWLRLRTMVRLDIPVEKRDQTDWEADVTFGLRHEEFIPNKDGYGKNIANDYPRVSSGPRVPVQIFRRDDPQESVAAVKEEN